MDEQLKLSLQITTPICFQASRIDSGGTGKQGTIIFNTTCKFRWRVRLQAQENLLLL